MKLILRVPIELLKTQQKDLVTLLRLGAGVNAMETIIRLLLRVERNESSATARLARQHCIFSALAHLREIVKTVEAEGFVDRFLELVEKGIEFSAVRALALNEVRALLSPTPPDSGNPLLKIRDKVAFHWDPGPFRSLLATDDIVIDLLTVDGDQKPDRIFAASAYAIAQFALEEVPADSRTPEDLSSALTSAVALLGHALEAAFLGLIVDAGGIPPTKYLVRG